MSSAARPAAPAGAGGPAVQRQQRPGQQPAERQGWGGGIRQAIQLFLLMQALQMGLKYFMGPKTPAAAPNTGDATASGNLTVKSTAAGHVLPLWPQGTIFDAHLYVTYDPHTPVNYEHPQGPHVSFTGLKYGDWTWKEQWDIEIVLPRNVQNNGSLYLDTVLVRNGSPLTPAHRDYVAEDVQYARRALMQYQKQKRVRSVKNLISSSSGSAADLGSVEEENAKDQAMPIISYYHPNTTINLVSNSGAFPKNQISPPIMSTNNETAARYYPIVFYNAFWQLKEASYPINETVASVPLHVDFEPIGITKFQILASLDDSFKQAANNPMGGASAGDFDEIKRVLLETNPILLATTILVTILHSLFEFLAFKNDISHTRNRKDNTGVSLRSIVTNVIVQLIVTLYLFDNSTDTSLMILASQGIGLAIEAWKITQAVKISVSSNDGGWLPYKIKVEDKHELSADEKATQEYDALAFKWVIRGTTPLLIGYTIYSLVYESHRSWYSFVISTLTSFVYMFGFIQLIPALIINYKLKSVAHMPMRSLLYKFFATIVDDFFSFVIKMPTMHRLACFRDDICFVILLYQYYLYPVDKKRANEFGQKLEALETDKAEPEKEELKAKAVEVTKESRKDR